MKWIEPYDGNVTIDTFYNAGKLRKKLPVTSYSEGIICIFLLLGAVVFTTFGILTPIFFPPNAIFGILEAIFIMLAIFGWMGFFGFAAEANKNDFRYVKIYSKFDSIRASDSVSINAKWLKYSIYQDAINEYYEELRWAIDNGVQLSVVYVKWTPIFNTLNGECEK